MFIPSYGRDPLPLVPRNGLALIVLIVARISGCANQKEISLDDQVAHAHELVGSIYDGPVKFIIVSTKAKGEALDRPELEKIEKHLRIREVDLFILEDLGRLVRGEEAVRLLGIGVDHGVRIICPNDGIDTTKPGWHEDALSACRDHVAHNDHTSRRIKFKNMNRFKHHGGCPALPIAGYIVPDGAKFYDQWQRNALLTPIVQKMIETLMDDSNFEAVGDWLNREGFPVGSYCRRKTWDGKMVKRFITNPILKGMPQRGAKHSVKNHETGRRTSRVNPDGPTYYQAPHLAHVTPEAFDALMQKLKDDHANLGRKPGDKRLGFLGLKRANSVFPGKCARCYYCGRILVWGGNGIATNMMCPGSREYACWNSIGVNGHMLATKVVEVIERKLCDLKGFETQFQAMVQAARESKPDDLESQNRELDVKEKDLQQKVKNFNDAVAKFGADDILAPQVEQLQAELQSLNLRRVELKHRESAKAKLPATLSDVVDRYREAAETLGRESYLFANYLRKLVPEIHVYNVRMRDHPLPLPRARIVIDPLGDCEAAKDIPELQALSHEVVTVDLFELPPREQFRQQAVELSRQRLTLEEIAKRLPVRISEKTVSLALKLQALLEAENTTDPLVFMAEPPMDCTKLRRHRRDKYRFRPVDGHVPPAVT